MAVRQWKEEDLPWTRELFKTGDRVTWTKKAIEHRIPTRSRSALRGHVVKTDVGEETGVTYTVWVMWDGYKRPHSYAGCFITKAKG